MSTLSPDSSPEAEQLLIERYRAMDPAEKMRILFELQRTMDEIALVGIRERHPGCSDTEQRLRLAALKYEPLLMLRAFGWDPRVEGY